MTSTPPQQYCLRWNNYSNNLTNVFDQLLQSESFVDVTLACEGHSLKAHKVVLSACSPYFQSLFFDNPCKHPIVILNGIKWDELKSVVEFMYRGEINVSQEQLAPLLKVAEVLKIRGLADVSRGGPGSTTLGATNPNDPLEKGRNLADFLANSNHEILDSGSESPSHANGHHHTSSMHPTNPTGNNPAALSPAQAHLMLASLSRRKRRKMSTPERTPSPPDDDMDDHSNQLEIDSTNGDYDHSPPPLSSGNMTGRVSESPNNLNAISMSLNSSPGNNHGHGGPHGQSSLGSIGPALMNLHAAAAAAAAVANAANQGSSNSLSGSGNPGQNSGGGSSSVSNDLDIKPGIVEMIREEERAKMLESAHGWLGPSNSTLSDSYQYQIQNLWQKCWNQNQTGMMHALRFRERGPLKSWRPETMAEAIFAVLREGLSLSQAARKYDIPYPTFVLYANRVHNMLGPSADGSTSSDLMSDMRPKGRGRPQRILLGTWPEEHIRGVIRAVVFRDTQTKDDMPFVFNRDGGLCIPQTPGGSQNGIDMSLHPQFGGSNPFLGAPSSSQGQSSTNSTPQLAGTSGSSSSQQGINLINLNESGNAAQHLQIQMSHGTSASSSTSSSPLQQALTANALSGIGAQAQSQLLALQQRHLQQQLQLQHRRSSSSDQNNLSLSPPGLGHKKNSYSSHSHHSHHGSIGERGKESPPGKERGGEKEILQIKTELLAPFDMDEEDEALDDEDERGIQDHDDDVRDEDDEMDDRPNEVGLAIGTGNGIIGGTITRGINDSYGSISGGVKSTGEQDLSCNNNKGPNNSTNNNNNNNSTSSVGGNNSIDDGQASQRNERGEVNTPSPKNQEHQTTTSS